MIPAVSIETAIQTDIGLQTVISNIHTTQTTLATATTVSVEQQTISESIIKYDVVLEVNGQQTQAVYIWNSQTHVVTPIVIAPVPADVEAYFITTTQTEEGITIISNDVTQISVQYPSVTTVLNYASTQQILTISESV